MNTNTIGHLRQIFDLNDFTVVFLPNPFRDYVNFCHGIYAVGFNIYNSCALAINYPD